MSEPMMPKTGETPTFEVGSKVTWTQKGIEASERDPMDSALVVRGMELEVMGGPDEMGSIPVKTPDGRQFPANAGYLQKI